MTCDQLRLIETRSTRDYCARILETRVTCATRVQLRFTACLAPAPTARTVARTLDTNGRGRARNRVRTHGRVTRARETDSQ